MKIVVTSYYLPPTDRIGSGVQMHLIANEYARMGHEVTLVSPVDRCEPDALYQLVTVRVNGNNRVWKWAKLLAEFDYDADFVHFSGDDFLVPTKANYIHLRTFMGSCLAEAKVAPALRDKIRMTFLGLTEVASSVRYPLSTVISSDTNRYLPRRGRIIPCGVDLRSFFPGQSRHSHPAILFVGTFDSRKQGRKLLSEFQNIVRPRIPDAELWVVRETEPVDVPGVTVFGSVSQKQLVDLFQQAWIFCLPSSYEGFGLPYVEALACGTPVVATANPGAMDVLGGGKYGLITELDQLGTALVKLLNDADLRLKYSTLGLERATQYDIHNVAQKYIELIQTCRSMQTSK
jgi:phosphatidylinositol alpha-mannosyltransferase